MVSCGRVFNDTFLIKPKSGTNWEGQCPPCPLPLPINAAHAYGTMRRGWCSSHVNVYSWIVNHVYHVLIMLYHVVLLISIVMLISNSEDLLILRKFWYYSSTTKAFYLFSQGLLIHPKSTKHTCLEQNPQRI